jgi:pentatricopeptide repeat protein
MSSQGFKPTPFMFELVISALAKRSSWRRALQLLDVMDDLHIQKTVLTYNTVISACARAGEVGTAKNVLAKMKQSGVKPNIISFNSLMAACASTSRWKDALSILDQCHREPGVQPDIITYTNAMRACAKGRQTNRALALLQVVKDMKLPIDAYCYTAVIDACAKGKRWKTALELLEEMEANGIMPNAITYSVAINACGNGGQAKEALALLDQMKEKKMRINLITYNSAITALSKASKMNAKFPGQSNDSRQAASVTFPKSEVVNVDNEQLWVQALELIEQIKAEGMKPDGFSYSAAISCCGSGGRWKEALEIIETMQKGGPKMRPNKIAYTAAISACGRSGKYKEALKLFTDMKNQGLHPDRIAYNAVFSALRVANRPEEAYQLWNEICGKCNAKPTASSTATPLAVSPDIITVSDVIGTLSRAETIDKDKVDEVFEEAVKRGIVLREESLDSDYEVDLTGMTLPVARAACRYIFNRILANYRKGEKPSEVTLLTGVGRAQQQQQQDGMGDGEKKLTALREYILQDLEEDFDPPMHGIVPQRAQGTVAIAQNQVEAWIAGQ